MVGATIVFMTTSYVIPQGILAWRGRDKILPPRALNLGKWGLPLNVLACVWVAFIDVVYCIPTAYPVTLENMNWIRYVPEPCKKMLSAADQPLVWLRSD
jgi:choline transport protein